MKPSVALVPLDETRVMIVHAESLKTAQSAVFADVVDVVTGEIVQSDRVDDADRDAGALDCCAATSIAPGRVLVQWEDRTDYARSKPRHIEARVFHDGTWSEDLSDTGFADAYLSIATPAGDAFFASPADGSLPAFGWSPSTSWRIVDRLDGWVTALGDGRIARLTPLADQTVGLSWRDGLGPWSGVAPTGRHVERSNAVGDRLLLWWHDTDDAVYAQPWSPAGEAGEVTRVSTGAVAWSSARFGRKSYHDATVMLATGELEWVGVLQDPVKGAIRDRPHVRRLAGGVWGPSRVLPFTSAGSAAGLRLRQHTVFGPILDRDDGTWIVPRTDREFGPPVLLAAASSIVREVVVGAQAVWIVAGEGPTPSRFGRYDPTTHAVEWITLAGLILPSTPGGALDAAAFEDPLGAFVLESDVLDDGAKAFSARWDGRSLPEVFPKDDPALTPLHVTIGVPHAPGARSEVIPMSADLLGTWHPREHVVVYNPAGVADVVIDPTPAEVGENIGGPGPALAIGCGGVTTFFAHGAASSGQPFYRSLEVSIVQ